MSLGIDAPRVLMVTPRFPPYVGGVETHVREVAAHLARSGVSTHVLTTVPNGSLAHREELAGIEVRRVRAYPPGRDWYFAPGLIGPILHGPFDLVHVQGIHTLVAPTAMLAALAAHRPFVVTFHTGGHRSALRRRLRGTQWKLLSPLLRRAAALIAVSEFERSLFAQAAGIDPARIRVIRNGAGLPEAAAAKVAEDPDMVLSVGRLERYKGHHQAVAAMPHLLRLRPGARLTIVGDGPERDALRRQAEELAVGDRVTIMSIPAGDRDEMARVVAGAGLVVLLSEYEAHPVAVTEAQALGRRILVSDTTGLSEIAAAGLASAVPFDATARDLAAAMDATMSGPRSAAGAVPTWEACAEEVLDVYRSVLARRAALSRFTGQSGNR